MMGAQKGTLWVAVAAAMLVPARARARGPAAHAGAGHDGAAAQHQGRRRAERRPQSLPQIVSPCGRHVATVIDGAVFIDGRRVHGAHESVFVIAPPTWRRDGGALAWIERRGGEARLVVVPTLDHSAELLPWSLPAVSGDDQIFWAGPQRVIVGPALMAPRAVATWTE
jgi:hypothetical protein